MTSEHMEIPDLRTVVRHAAPRIVESTLVPLVLFLIFLRLLGVWGAMIAGLVWVYSLIVVRVCTGRRAGAFLFSVPLGHPLAGRLAADFCPLSKEMHANTHVRRFFRQISFLWAFVQTANAGITIWLLFSQSLATFVLLRSVVSAGVTITAIVASALWFKRSMARHGIVVQLPTWRRAAA